jgi:hypothetical protein
MLPPPPDYLSHIIDVLCCGTQRARHIDLSEASAGKDEAVLCTEDSSHNKKPDDLSRVVDATSLSIACAGHVDSGEAPATVEETVGYPHAVIEESNDLPCVVDAKRRGLRCAGHVDLSEGVGGGIGGMDRCKPADDDCRSKDDHLVHAESSATLAPMVKVLRFVPLPNIRFPPRADPRRRYQASDFIY